MISNNKIITDFLTLLFFVTISFLIAGCAVEYEVVLTAEPAQGGETLGGGTYRPGETAYVTAETARGYNFINWTIDGEAVSAVPEHEFVVDEDVLLVAVFEKKADPEEALGSGKEEEKKDENLLGEEIFKFPMAPVLLTPAPGGRHFYFYLPSNPVDIYYLICMDSLEHEPLPAPGIESGQVASIDFTLDGGKIAYFVLSPLAVEEEIKARIYFGSSTLPFESDHSFALGYAEIISDADVNHHRNNYSSNPVWKLNGTGIYYFTTGGLRAYSLEEMGSRQLFSRNDLDGLFLDKRLAPHAFLINDEQEILAYLADREELTFIDLAGEKETEKVTVKGAEDTETLKYIFEGKYLALHSERLALVYGGGKFLLYKPETDELVKLEEKLYSYAFNEQYQLLTLTDRPYDSGRKLKLYDADLNLLKSVNVPGNFSEVFWLGDQWAVLIFDVLYRLEL